MFNRIGNLAAQYRWPLVIVWLSAAILITMFAPNLDDVVSNDNSDFLPDDASTVIGLDLLQEHFPEQNREGGIVVVFDAGETDGIYQAENMAFIEDVSLWLNSENGPEHLANVQSPALNPDAASFMISPDGQVAMVTADVTSTLEEDHIHILEGIQEELAAAPNGMSTYRTGQLAIFNEYNETITEDVDRTLMVTLVLVVVILLAIYRSPVSPLIPLTVVTIAFMIARGLVAIVADNVLTVSGTATMLLIVVMYGAGTDYCLFLISRFREEMAANKPTPDSVKTTVRHVGESISSSAGTTTTGFMAMAFAQLGLFNTTGPTLAIGVVVSLLAGLTLTPAILGLLGQRAFWPAKAQQRGTGALYRRTSQLVSSRPLLTIIVIVLIMSPLCNLRLRARSNL